MGVVDLLAAIEAIDPQRVARWRYWSHARRCWTGGDTKLCERCRQLDLDASAEDWRRSQQEAAPIDPRIAGSADGGRAQDSGMPADSPALTFAANNDNGQTEARPSR